MAFSIKFLKNRINGALQGIYPLIDDAK